MKVCIKKNGNGFQLGRGCLCVRQALGIICMDVLHMIAPALLCTQMHMAKHTMAINPAARCQQLDQK